MTKSTLEVLFEEKKDLEKKMQALILETQCCSVTLCFCSTFFVATVCDTPVACLALLGGMGLCILSSDTPTKEQYELQHKIDKNQEQIDRFVGLDIAAKTALLSGTGIFSATRRGDRQDFTVPVPPASCIM